MQYKAYIWDMIYLDMFSKPYFNAVCLQMLTDQAREIWYWKMLVVPFNYLFFVVGSCGATTMSLFSYYWFLCGNNKVLYCWFLCGSNKALFSLTVGSCVATTRPSIVGSCGETIGTACNPSHAWILEWS
jgi:hypothetical protein